MKITVRTPAEFQKPDLSPEEERGRDAEIRRSVRRQISEQTGQPYCSYFRDEDDPDCPYVVETLDQNPTRLRLSDGTIYECAPADPNSPWVAFFRKVRELAEVLDEREAEAARNALGDEPSETSRRSDECNRDSMMQ